MTTERKGNMIHKLKIQPEYFQAVCSKKKSFEIRNNDRDFQVGDTLQLQEWLYDTQEYTGRVVERKVTYITDYAQHRNFVVMAIV
jgi:ASC-1-like (ASCH) protein